MTIDLAIGSGGTYKQNVLYNKVQATSSYINHVGFSSKTHMI